jgi:hypothetical protein
MEISVTSSGAIALGKLMDDLARGGWLLGVRPQIDPAMSRMDPASGALNGPTWDAMVREALLDHESGRGPRPGDGPARGAVAVIDVHLSSPDPRGADAFAETGKRLWDVLRAEDLLGRTGPDCFSLLLRGCPAGTLSSIAARCREAAARPVLLDGREIPVRAAVSVRTLAA